MNANTSVIVSGTNPGDISGGSAAPPGNVESIMQSMLSQVITPDQISDTGVVNKAPVTPSPRADPGKVDVKPNTIKPVVLTEPAKEAVKIDPVKDSGADVNFFAEEPVEEVTAPVDEEPDMSDIPDDPKTENFKKLREAIKFERKDKRGIAKDFEATKAELERYKKGEVIPEIITAKDTKIQQLEKYETIVNGKLSEEYQTLVVKPIGEKQSALNKLAEDYQVPENIKNQLIQKIVETENEKERNSLITRYFPDAIGATKVEALVKELHQLGETALEMEKKPAEVMQTLQSQYKAKREKESEVVASQFESVSKVSWTKALEKTAAEGLFPELIMDSTNAEHSKVAEKNQHRAGIQYGALVKKLHENGLRTLPEDLATGLARAIQLSIGGVGIAKQLDAANKRIAELEGNNGMIATYFRPGMNSNGSKAPPPVATNNKGPVSPKEAGRMAAQVFRGV